MNRIAERELNVGETADAASCPYKKIWQKTYTANLQPLRKGGFKKTRYSLCQCLAISCCRLMHTRFKVAPVDMSLFVSRLWSMSVAELEAEFAKGNTAFLIINRKPGDEFFRPEIVNDIDRYLREKGIVAEIVAVSLEREWNRILDRILPQPLQPAEVN